MKKKMAFFCLVLAVLSQTTVFADVEKAKLSGNTCSVSGTAEGGETISVLITNGGKTGGNVDKAVTFESFHVKNSGNFDIQLNMNDSRIGEKKSVSVFVKVGENERKEFTLDYVSPVELKNLIKSMKDSKDSAALLKIISDASNKTAFTALGFEMELWENSDKENTTKILFADKSIFDKTPFEMEKSFKMATLLSSYKSVKNTPFEINDMINLTNPIKCEDIIWDELKINTAKSSKVLNYMQKNSPFLSNDILNMEFGAGAIFYDLKNAAAYGTLRDTLEKYKDVLELEKQSYYPSYSKNKDQTSKELIKLLASITEIESRDNFHKLMKKAVENIPTTDNGGGGGSGGGGGGSTMPAPVIDKNKEKPDEVTSNQLFIDLSSDHWAYGAVRALSEKKVINGYEDGSFQPDKKVTREEFVTMLINALDIATIGGTCPFDDVEYGKWYSPYVSTAYMKGMINGIDKNHFGIGEQITRQDISSILMRARAEYPTENIREYVKFSDDENISEYAKEAVKIMYEQGVINGTEGYFNPKSLANRAETAVMIYNFININ